MSELQEQLHKSQGLLSATGAITHRRAFITLYGTYALATIMFAGVGSIAASLMLNGHYDSSKLVGLAGVLLAIALVLLGTSATGFLLNDTVRGRETKTISQAIWSSIATAHRLIGVLAVLFALALLAVLVIFVAMFLCKIPGLGPLLFAVAFPVSAVLLGLIFYVGFFIVSLHGPAIWEGNDVFGAVSVLGAIFRERLFPVVIQTILLGFLVGLVASLIFGVLAVGVSMTGAISIPVLGQTIGPMNPMELLQGFMSESSGTAYLKAGMFGLTLLGGLAITIPVLVAIAGNCIIFANVTEDLSTAEMDKKLKGVLEVARQKAEQARRQLDEARAQVSAQATAAPVAVTLRCPKCSTPYEPNDAFCGSCGQRLG
jgi:hypothetical protein